MKISELIVRLQEIQATHGDLPCQSVNRNGHRAMPLEISEENVGHIDSGSVVWGFVGKETYWTGEPLHDTMILSLVFQRE